MSTTDDVLRWRDRTAYGADGDKIGDVKEIYLDEESGQPEWALVNTGMFGTKSSFVPVRGGRQDGDDIRLAYTQEQVKNAPSIDADEELTPEEERRLYDHYDLDYDAVDRDADVDRGTRDRDRMDRGEGGTVGHDTSGRETDDAMTRSEEELRVGTQRRETGKVRLRKHVETEHVSERVPVEREEVRIEREPVTEADADRATDGPSISEEEHEVTVHEDVAVAEKKAVPQERIRIEKDVVTDEEEVDAELRKERVEADDSGTR